MASPNMTNITGLKVPGTKRRAAPGLPEIAISLGQLMELEFKWVPVKETYYAIRKTIGGGEHVFDANPKIMHTEDLWVEWGKIVADFLAGKGEPIRASDVATQMATLQAIQVDDNGLESKTAGTRGSHQQRAWDGEFDRGTPDGLFLEPDTGPASGEHVGEAAATDAGAGEPQPDQPARSVADGV